VEFILLIFIKGPITEKTFSLKISPHPSLTKRGNPLPFVKACLPVGREARRDLVFHVYTIIN
jgi:hypothetical protein